VVLGEVSDKTDSFAFGIVVIELITGLTGLQARTLLENEGHIGPLLEEQHQLHHEKQQQQIDGLNNGNGSANDDGRDEGSAGCKDTLRVRIENKRGIIGSWPMPVLQTLSDIAMDLTTNVRNRHTMKSTLPRLELLLASLDNVAGMGANNRKSQLDSSSGSAHGAVGKREVGGGKPNANQNTSPGRIPSADSSASSFHAYGSETNDEAAAISQTPYVPFELLEDGKYETSGGVGKFHWRSRPVMTALTFVAALALAVGLGLGLTNGASSSPTPAPAPAPTPALAPTQACTGISASLISTDCSAWQRFFNSSTAQSLVSKVKTLCAYYVMSHYMPSPLTYLI
jgi:hypothetical protein